MDQAHQRARATFAQKAPLALDDQVLDAPWVSAPFEASAYTYTFDEIRQHWSTFMRGLRIPFPSPDYLKARYQRFPSLYRDLRYQDDNWEQHSRNVLEVWQAFFRGDFRHARELGKRYGGYARVPGLVAQIIYATYLAPSHTEKQQLLQEAIDQMAWFGEQVAILPGEESLTADYCMLRLGFGYAVARLAEDESVPATLQRNYAAMVINAATEILAVEPSHPLALSLSAAFEANVLRRVGKAAGRLTLAADSEDATQPFELSLAAVPDLAIVRYEYANSLLYTYQDEAAGRALAQLQKAADLPARFSMEWLDRAYARKRLQEVQAWRDSGMSFRRFDRKRRKFMRKENINLYAVTRPPFLVD
ncbi:MULTISPECIES: hypothetical protein [unclassified Alcanivorax]|uniref:hypothetical protein n=1 Tax=unclassified Alcanivorax TaxID=2638842 RepID=UPI001E5D2B2F|nr:MULTISPECIES: hypothetical protein [unclassified Alcanivorax]MEE2602051.1 hypothetical protein [Pseudomonadota bacterium]